MSPSLNRVSAPEAIVNHFKEQIASGALRAGDQLPSERALQEDFGISRFSLREGLARLNALGILNIRHGKGAFVAEGISAHSLEGVLTPLFSRQDPESAQALIEARNLLETQAAVLAGERAEEENLARLRTILEESRAALDDPDSFGCLDYEFHREISAAAKNVFLQKMLDALTEHLKPFLMGHARDAGRRKMALADHRKILRCLARRDTQNIGRAMKQHIVRCWKNFELEQAEERGASQ